MHATVRCDTAERGSGRHFVLFLFSRFPPTRPRGSPGPPSLPPSVERGIKNVRARVTLSRRPRRRVHIIYITHTHTYI